MDDGNGSLITHRKKREMIANLARQGNISLAARLSNIERSTHYKWLRNDPAYATAVDVAMEEAIEALEAVARQRAVKGSDTLLIFLLKSLRPAIYREHYEVRHTGAVRVSESADEILRDPEVADALSAAFERRASGGAEPRPRFDPPSDH